jgi:hypothetical protein
MVNPFLNVGCGNIKTGGISDGSYMIKYRGRPI